MTFLQIRTFVRLTNNRLTKAKSRTFYLFISFIDARITSDFTSNSNKVNNFVSFEEERSKCQTYKFEMIDVRPVSSR